MAYNGVTEDFQRIRENKIPGRVPVVADSEEFDVRWHGKYNYEEFCQDGDKMFEVFRAAIERFDYDWAWLQIDDCFEFEPVGVKVKGEGDILRATYGYLPANSDTLKNLPVLDPHRDGRMPEKLKAIKKLKDHFKDTVSFESIGPDADIHEIRRATKGIQPISGNLDPIKVLWQGNPDSISAEVSRIMRICKDGGGFIFNTGEMVPRQTPEENMDVYMRKTRSLADY